MFLGSSTAMHSGMVAILLARVVAVCNVHCNNYCSVNVVYKQNVCRMKQYENRAVFDSISGDLSFLHAPNSGSSIVNSWLHMTKLFGKQASLGHM